VCMFAGGWVCVWVGLGGWVWVGGLVDGWVDFGF